VAANVLLTEALKYRVNEIKAKDEEERLENPPKKDGSSKSDDN